MLMTLVNIHKPVIAVRGDKGWLWETVAMDISEWKYKLAPELGRGYYTHTMVRNCVGWKYNNFKFQDKKASRERRVSIAR